MADLKRRHPMRGQGGSSEHPDVAAQEARLDLEQRLAAEYDLELLDRARQRVRPRVDPRTWAVYVATAEDGRRPPEVAREFGMRVGSIYQAKYSIITQLRREIEILEGSP
jgi:hypothetical protein